MLGYMLNEVGVKIWKKAKKNVYKVGREKSGCKVWKRKLPRLTIYSIKLWFRMRIFMTHILQFYYIGQKQTAWHSTGKRLLRDERVHQLLQREVETLNPFFERNARAWNYWEECAEWVTIWSSRGCCCCLLTMKMKRYLLHIWERREHIIKWFNEKRYREMLLYRI